MSRRQRIREQGFVLEKGGRALLAFQTDTVESARALCAEDWFVEELASYRSQGRPIWDGRTADQAGQRV